MTPDLATLVSAWCTARRAVRNAQTRVQFLAASTELWEAERALEQAGITVPERSK